MAQLTKVGVRFIVAAWLLVLFGAVVIFVGYSSVPEAVVLYRPPWADVPTVGRKSFLAVGRIVLMGAGQVGAATAMAFAARGSLPWRRFWRWLGLAAGVKTLLECVGLIMPHGAPAERVLTTSTFAAVGLFALSAAWWWRRGELRAHPPLTGRPRIWLVASLALWAVFAVAPRALA